MNSKTFLSTESRIARLALFLPKLKPRRAKQVEMILDRIYRNLYSTQTGAGKKFEDSDEEIAQLEDELEALDALEAEVDQLEAEVDDREVEINAVVAEFEDVKAETQAEQEAEAFAEFEAEQEAKQKAELKAKQKAELKSQQATKAATKCDICYRVCKVIEIPPDLTKLTNAEIIKLSKNIKNAHAACGLCSDCIDAPTIKSIINKNNENQKGIKHCVRCHNLCTVIEMPDLTKLTNEDKLKLNKKIDNVHKACRLCTKCMEPQTLNNTLASNIKSQQRILKRQ